MKIKIRTRFAFCQHSTFFVAMALLSWGLAATNAQLIYQRVKSTPFGDNPDITMGYNPLGTLIEGIDGMLYGTMSQGGGPNPFPSDPATNGTIFRVNKDGSGFAPLWKFTSPNDGMTPCGGVLQASDGSFFGTTFFGGLNNRGTVFRLAKNGNGYTNQLLKSFAGSPDGANPQAALLFGTDGILYGTTYAGGLSNKGCVFKINQNGTGYQILTNFSGFGGMGAFPQASLIQGTDGMLYGVTIAGGSSGVGTVFRLNTNGTGLQVLKSLGGVSTEAANPRATLVQGPDGVLYGTATNGGSFSAGAVFKLNTDGSSYSRIKNFGDPAFAPDGRNPLGPLAFGTDGALYGTAYSGGLSNQGIIFRLSTNGAAYTPLQSFTSGPFDFEPLNDGAFPAGGLLLARDGGLYGTTVAGGQMLQGTIFSLSARPANDAFANRIQLSGVTTVGNGYNLNATLENGEPSHGDFSATNSVWWSWSGLPNGLVTVVNDTLTMNSVLDVYTSASATNPACISAPAGLLNWWPASGNGNDIIGGNNGILSNGLSFASGEVGTGFNFDGTNGYFQIGAAPLPVPWTAEFWVNRQPSIDDSAVLLGDSVSALKLEQYPNQKKVGVTIWNVKDYAFNYTTPIGTWTHLVFVGTSTNTQLYVNGTLQGTTNVSFSLPRNQMGNDITNRNTKRLKGGVDETSVFNRALAASEILSLYNSGAAGKCGGSSTPCTSPPAGLVNWWPANGDPSDIVSGLNGTVSNGLTFAPGQVGQAFNFDGTNGLLQIGGTPIPAPWSAEFWVNRQASIDDSAVLLGDSVAALKLEQYPNQKKVGVTVWNVKDYAFNYTAPTSTWVHLVFVGTTTNTQLYANGVLQGTTNVSFALPRNQMGNDITNRNIKRLKGFVDETSLYSRALSQSEILSLYNAGTMGKCVSSGFGSIAGLIPTASNGSTQYLGSPNRVSFVANSASTYHIAVSGVVNEDIGPNFAGSGDIALKLRTLDFRLLSVTPTLTNAANETLFNAVAQIGNANSPAPGPLRIELIARAGFNRAASSNVNVSLLPDQVVGTYYLANPATVGLGTTTNVTISSKCPAPTNYVVGGTTNFIGWGVFALLEQQADTNWFLKDSDLVMYGQWPIEGGFGGPGGGVIRINPTVSGGSFNPVSLTNVTIIGPAGVMEGTTNLYYGTAKFDFGAPVNFTNTVWTSSIPSIRTNGAFTAGIVTSNTQVTIGCFYTYDATNAATRVITVTNLPPPSLSNVVELANKLFQFTVTGVPGRKHIIQATTNLSSPVVWTNLATNPTAPNGTLIYLDTTATNLPRRFYRVEETP